MTSALPAPSDQTKAASRRRRWAVVCGLALIVVGVAFFAWPRPTETDRTPEPVAPAGPAWFADKTAGSGVDFTYRNGEEADQFTILESLGGGVAMLDFDGDGLLDLFFTGGGSFDAKQIKGRPCKLYKNLGDFKFRDVTAEAGPRHHRFLHARQRRRRLRPGRPARPAGHRLRPPRSVSQ